MEAIEQSEHLKSPHNVKKEDWDNMGSAGSEAALSMPGPIKSESDISFFFSDQKSHQRGPGCSTGSAENEYNNFDIKTEIKSELTVDEYEPSELARWFMDPIEDNATPKEESDEVSISIRNVQDAEDSVNKESLEETQGVECDSEVLTLTEPEKSHQDGRVCHVLRYSSTAKIPAGDADTTDPLLELCSSLQEESDVVSSSDVENDSEASVSDESLEETQGVDHVAEGLTLTEPEKSHQDGCVRRVLRYSSTATNPVGEADATDLLPDLCCSEHPISKRKSTDRPRDKGDYTCSICGKVFTCSSSLCRHRILHKGKKPHVCRLCGSSFSRKYHLDRHMLIHTGRVKVHKRDRERSYLCDLCGKSFYHIDTLQEHRKRHSQFRPFKCDQCNKDFKVRSDFLKHQQTHTGFKPYVCKECGQGFTRAHSLQKHLRAHTGETPFSCSHCQKKFRSKWGLSNHLKKCTDEQPPHVHVDTGQKPHSCPQCPKRYRWKYQLKHHMEKCIKRF